MVQTTAQRLLQEEALQKIDECALPALPTARKNTRLLRLNQIVRNPKNREINMEKVHELMESIQMIGLLHDIVVKPIGDQSYMLVSGEHRYTAFKLLAQTEFSYELISCKIIDHDELHSELALLDGNLKSNALSPYDEVIALGRREEILKDLNTPGIMRDVIAKEVGGKPTQIGKKLRIYKRASPEVLQALKEGAITIETASKLAALDPAVQRVRLSDEHHAPQEHNQKTEQDQYISLLNKAYKTLENLNDFYYDHERYRSAEFSKVLSGTNAIKRNIRALLYELTNGDSRYE